MFSIQSPVKQAMSQQQPHVTFAPGSPQRHPSSPRAAVPYNRPAYSSTESDSEEKAQIYSVELYRNTK